MAKKVYCNKCKFIQETHEKDKPTLVDCIAPANKKQKDTPVGPIVVLLKKPEQLNKNNDCKLYVASRPAAEPGDDGPKVGLKTIMNHERRLVELEGKVESLESAIVQPETPETDNSKESPDEEES